METPRSFGDIEDVSVGTNAYIRQQWGKKFFIPLGALVVLGIILLYWIRIPHVFMPALAWWVIGYAIAHKLVQVEFMRQFAKKNGFTHDVITERPSHGCLFDRGDGRVAWNAVIGARGGLPLRFFLYRYTTGSGKNRSTHPFTVAEIAFHGNVPEVIVDTRDDWYVDGAFGKHQKLSTGTEFDKHFVLRVVEDHEIETLEVFTPEVMEEIIRRGKGYSFEFVGDHLYVWKPGYARKSENLRHMLELAHYLIDTLSNRLGRLHGDVAAIKNNARK